MEWQKIKDNPPPVGIPVIVIDTHHETDTDWWTDDIVYYCDGSFWTLEYDNKLGIMRKTFFDAETPEYWTRYCPPEYPRKKPVPIDIYALD